MKILFTTEQIELSKKIGVPFDITKNLSDDELFNVEDLFGDYLNLHCLDDDYKPNHEGEVCYQVIDKVVKA